MLSVTSQPFLHRVDHAPSQFEFPHGGHKINKLNFLSFRFTDLIQKLALQFYSMRFTNRGLILDPINPGRAKSMRYAAYLLIQLATVLTRVLSLKMCAFFLHRRADISTWARGVRRAMVCYILTYLACNGLDKGARFEHVRVLFTWARGIRRAMVHKARDGLQFHASVIAKVNRSEPQILI